MTFRTSHIRVLKMLGLAALIGLVGFALFNLELLSNLYAAIQALSSVSFWAVLILALLQIASILLVNLQWHFVAKLSTAHVSFGQLLHINCQGSIADSLTPGVKVGGELTRSVQLVRKAQCSKEEATAILALQKLFSISAFAIISLAALGYLLFSLTAVRSAATSFFLSVTSIERFLVLLLLILLVGCSTLIARVLISRHHKARKFCILFADQIKSASRKLQTRPMTSLGLLALSLFIWLLYPLKFFILLAQLNPGISQLDPSVLGQLTAIPFVAYMAALLPLTPGGLGSFEAVMTGLLAFAGMGAALSLVSAVLYRFFTFWLSLLLSVIYLFAHKIVVSLPQVFFGRSIKKKSYRYV